MQIRAATLPVSDPVHHHVTENRGQDPFPARLGTSTAHPIGVDHLRQDLLPLRPQVKMVLHSLAGQVPEPDRDLGLQITVGQPGRLVLAQPVHSLREQPPQGTERILVGFQRVGSHPGSFFLGLASTPKTVVRRSLLTHQPADSPAGEADRQQSPREGAAPKRYWQPNTTTGCIWSGRFRPTPAGRPPLVRTLMSPRLPSTGKPSTRPVRRARSVPVGDFSMTVAAHR